jgi:hypothetical protein
MSIQILSKNTPSSVTYEGVSKSFRTGRLEPELQTVKISATRCSCIALRISLVSFCRHNPLCCFSTNAYFCCLFLESVRKLLGTPSYQRTSDRLKVKLSPCFNWAPRHEDILKEWRYSSTHSSTLALDGGEWSASRPGRFTPRERAAGTHWIGGWVGPRVGVDKNSRPRPGLKPPIIQLVA